MWVITSGVNGRDNLLLSPVFPLFSLFFPGSACSSYWVLLALRGPVASICDFVQQLWRRGGYPKVVCWCRLCDHFFSIVGPLEEGGLSEIWVICNVWSTPWWSQGLLVSYLTAAALQNTFICLPVSSVLSSWQCYIFDACIVTVSRSTGFGN